MLIEAHDQAQKRIFLQNLRAKIVVDLEGQFLREQTIEAIFGNGVVYRLLLHVLAVHQLDHHLILSVYLKHLIHV